MAMSRTFKQRLLARERVVMMNPDHPSPSLVEFIGGLGADAVMIDMEQGSPGAERVEDMARAARAAGLCALVRIFAPEPWVIERYMLRGIHGIVVPRVETVPQAREVVESVRYCFPTNAEDKIVIMQVETAGLAEALDALIELPGIDAYFIGPVDLAKSLGKGGDYRDPAVIAVIESLVGRLTAAGKAAGMLVTASDVGFWRARGVTLLYNHLNEYAKLGASYFEAAEMAKTLA
jgi:4-hydroxy-2-oxoheptanedioate aldolase